jgi:Flp pilus assembly protein TadG
MRSRGRCSRPSSSSAPGISVLHDVTTRGQGGHWLQGTRAFVDAILVLTRPAKRSNTARRPASSRERGAAFVEFALVVPLLFSLVLGGLTGGIVLSRKQSLTHAAREGARYGAVVPQSQCDPTSNCGGLTWAQLVQSVVVQRSVGTTTNAQVCVSLVSGSAGTVVNGDAKFTTKPDGTACYADGSGDPGTRVQVSISRPGESINAVFFRLPVTLNAQATARFEA